MNTYGANTLSGEGLCEAINGRALTGSATDKKGASASALKAKGKLSEMRLGPNAPRNRCADAEGDPRARKVVVRLLNKATIFCGHKKTMISVYFIEFNKASIC
jgi:hypothetical protein